MKLGIAGVGLIGGSIGLRAATLGWEVAGWDPAPGHLGAALARGALGRPAGSLAELAGWADVLVLAAPLDATLEQLEELTRLAGGGARTPPAIFDVASVKAPVARAGAGLPAFVPTHPIAGSERSGPGAATRDLFADRVWTYDPAAPAAAAAREFIAALGARPVAIASVEHDRIVALTSHLPQLVSVALGSQLAPALAGGDAAALCGTGVASMLRLAGSSWTVWRAILAANAISVAQEVRRLAGILSDVATALEHGETEALAARFEAASFAAALLGANGAVPSDVSSNKHVATPPEPPVKRVATPPEPPVKRVATPPIPPVEQGAMPPDSPADER